jgi:uncharacterized membrane protein YgcG
VVLASGTGPASSASKPGLAPTPGAVSSWLEGGGSKCGTGRMPESVIQATNSITRIRPSTVADSPLYRPRGVLTRPSLKPEFQALLGSSPRSTNGLKAMLQAALQGGGASAASSLRGVLAGRTRNPAASLGDVGALIKSSRVFPGVAGKDVRSLLSKGSVQAARTSTKAYATGSACAAGDITTLSTNMYPLQDACKIWLGVAPELALLGWNGSIEAEVPSGYKAETSETEMLAALVPEWYAAVHSAQDAWDSVEAIIEHFTNETDVRETGLFFTEPPGYFYYILRYAIVTLYAYSARADNPSEFATTCNTSSSILRDDIERAKMALAVYSSYEYQYTAMSGGAWLHAMSDGKFRVTRYSEGPQAWTYFGVVHMSPCNQAEAAIADYYLWWANRLYSYALHESGSALDMFTAMMCARCAVSEIVEMAAVILHEYSHVTGSSYHCKELWSEQDCCQYMLEYHFRHQVWAELGMPQSHLVDFATTDSDRDDDRFETITDWTYKLHGAPDCDGDDTEMFVKGCHDHMLAIDHAVRVSFAVAAKCSSGATSSGTNDFGGEPDDDSSCFGGGGSSGGSGGRKEPPPSKDSGIPRRDKLY